MTVKIDPEMCVGCGLCEENMPHVFIMKNQIAHVIPSGIETVEKKDLDDMVEDCPAEAISYKES